MRAIKQLIEYTCAVITKQVSPFMQLGYHTLVLWHYIFTLHLLVSSICKKFTCYKEASSNRCVSKNSSLIPSCQFECGVLHHFWFCVHVAGFGLHLGGLAIIASLLTTVFTVEDIWFRFSVLQAVHHGNGVIDIRVIDRTQSCSAEVC